MIKSQHVSQVEGNIVSDMGGEKVMLNIQQGKYYNLGDVGGEIWERIKDPILIQELIGTLMARYDVEQTECEEQVLAFLDHLVMEGLVQIHDQES